MSSTDHIEEKPLAGEQPTDSPAYGTAAATTLVMGAPGTGKTQRLAECVGAAVEGGANPRDVLVLAASAPAAAVLADLVPQGVEVTTPMGLALEGLPGNAHRLASFEETFFLEDMRVTGQKQRRLREMLKFLERGWSEMREDEEGWLITGEEKAIDSFARQDLRAMGALHPTQVVAAYVRYLLQNEGALAQARRPQVFVDDYQAMSRASQRLARILATEELTVAWNTVGGLQGEEPYGYGEGLEELAAEVPQLMRVDCAQSCLAQAPAACVATLCQQPCMAAVEAPGPHDGGETGAFEAAVANDLQDEMPLLVERVAALLEEGMAPAEIYVAVPTDAWGRRACAALEGAGIATSRIEERQALGGDIRDSAKSAGALAYTALHLAADPLSAVAWRCWCGFGDYLGCSASMTALAEVANQTGATLPELLAALEAGEMSYVGVDEAKVVARYRAGQALLRAVEGLSGSELLAALGEQACGTREVPAALTGLVGAVDPNEDAATLYARAEAALVAPGFAPQAVRVGGFDAALGQRPRAVVACGMANGLVPSSAYFELTQATIDAQAKMHARLIERLAALAGKAREVLVCTTFDHAGIVEAETLKLKTERVRLCDGRRVCDLGPSVCIDYLSGAKLDYVR